MQMRRKRCIEILDDRGSLEVARVDRVDTLRTQRPEEVIHSLRDLTVPDGLDEGGVPRKQARDPEQIADVDEAVHPAQGHRGIEAGPATPGRDKGPRLTSHK